MMRKKIAALFCTLAVLVRMFVWNSICGKETEHRANGLICHMG